MESKCIIERGDVKGPFPGLAQYDYYKVRGKQPPQQFKISYYVNTQTKDKYMHIVGALAFPIEHNIPGFLIVMAAEYRKNPADKPILYVLEEFEERDLPLLFDACLAFRKKYGYRKYEGLFHVWYADTKNPLAEMAYKLHPNSNLVLESPPGLEDPSNLDLLAQTILPFLGEYEDGRKKLEMAKGSKLWNHLNNFDAGGKKREASFPAVSALAYGVAALDLTCVKPGGEAFNLED